MKTAHLVRAALACCAIAAFRPVRAQTASRVVITQAEIEAAGWQRINEILDVAPGWRLTSAEGFTYTPSPDGLPAAGASGPAATLPTVIVDGARVPVSLLGVQELEFVPVLLAQVDSVVFSSEPQIVAGRLEMRGVIRFYTRRPPRGVSAKGEFQVGDVANKPGLYWYTPLNPPNREHIGPFEHLLIGVGGTRVGLDVGVRYATLNTTDSLIQHRTKLPGGAGVNQINLPAPVAHLDISGLGGHHSVDATRAHYSGLFFIPAFGHEQSLRMNATTVNAAGDVHAVGGFGLQYAGGYTNDDVAPLPSSYPITVVHRRSNLDGSLELVHALGEMRGAIGGGAGQWTFDRYGVTSKRYTERAFVRLDQITTGPLASSVAGILTHSDGTNALGAVLSSAWSPTASDALRLAAGTQTEDPQTDGRWIDERVLGSIGSTAMRRTSSADLAWTHQLPRDLALLAGERVSSVSNWPAALASDTAMFFETTAELPPAPTIGSLDVSVTRLGLETARHERYYGRILYSYSAPFGGDTYLRTADRSIARHQVNGQAWLVPARDWRVMTLVQMVSSTYWQAFPSLADGYPPTVPGFSRVDLGVEKWMWRRRVRFQYQVRDIFNRSERWQPRSTQYNLRWLAAVSFALGPS